MKKKLFSTIAIFVVMLLCTSPVFALTINTGANNEQSSNAVVSSVTTLEKVKEDACEIDLKDDVTGDVIGKFTKELEGIDTSKKEVTLKLTLKNLMKEAQTKPTPTPNVDKTKPVEVFLVMDNSESMNDLAFDGITVFPDGKPTPTQKTKLDYVSEIADAFSDLLFEYFENVKIGVVSFSSTPLLEDGTANWGTEADAKLLLGLTDSNKDKVKTAITQYKTDTNHGACTNIEAGLKLAEDNFTTSTDSKKIVVLLSDGVPNLSLDTNKDNQKYSGTTATNTKNRLKGMEEKGYHIFSILMGLNQANEEVSSLFIANSTENRTNRSLAEEVFGTKANPTAGDFFYIGYDTLSTTLNTDIYNDITGKPTTTPTEGNEQADTTIKNIVIKDYFPKEIIDNFNFEYVKSPNIGKVSQKVDTTDNSITWTVELLKAEEVATLTYKLTLKDNYDKSIINKVLPTNEKVDISYEYTNGKGTTTSDVSPAVRIKYVESSKDDTTAKKPIPQTGIYTNMLFSVVAIVITLFIVKKVIAYKKLK